ARATYERIVARSAIEGHRACAGRDRVISITAGDDFNVGRDVVIFAGLSIVGRAIDRDDEIRAARRVIRGIGVRAAVDVVGVVPAVEGIVAGVTVERVGAVAAGDAVVS